MRFSSTVFVPQGLSLMAELVKRRFCNVMSDDTGNSDRAEVDELPSLVESVEIRLRPHAGDLAELSREVDAGRVRIEVQQALPLTDAAHAHEISQSGHVRGKLVLEVS